MTASDYPHRTPDHNRVGLHYKPFRLIWLTSPFAIQPLARTKFLQPGLNPRSRVRSVPTSSRRKRPGLPASQPQVIDINSPLSDTLSPKTGVRSQFAFSDGCLLARSRRQVRGSRTPVGTASPGAILSSRWLNLKSDFLFLLGRWNRLLCRD